jgi:ABC-type amino acid transport substrate-binding protein
MNMRVLQNIILIAVTIGLMPAAHATPENKEILVGFNNVAWPPYLIKETNGEIHGIMMDVMKEIAQKTRLFRQDYVAPGEKGHQGHSFGQYRCLFQGKGMG